MYATILSVQRYIGRWIRVLQWRYLEYSSNVLVRSHLGIIGLEFRGHVLQ